MHYVGDLSGDERRDSIANLDKLIRPAAQEKIVIWERLQPCRLPHREASALRWVPMNEGMAILSEVAGDCAGGLTLTLDPKPVSEMPRFPALVVWRELDREIAAYRRSILCFCERSNEHVSSEIRRHMTSSFVI